MVSTAILFVTGIGGVVSHVTATDFEFEWYYPFSIILIGFLCALPTVFLILAEGAGRMRRITRLTLHCLIEFIIVAVVGYLFHWYRTPAQLPGLAIRYFAVYFFVWVASIWSWKVEEKQINEALKKIQDEE